MKDVTEVRVSGRGLAWMVWAIYADTPEGKQAFDTLKVYRSEAGAVKAARRLNAVRGLHSLDYRYVAVLVETLALKAVV